MPSIRYFENLPTIARINRYTGDIDVNAKQMNALPSLIQRFIIEHELGHYNLQTNNEFEADYYAFKKIAGTAERSLKLSIDALTNVLNFKNPEHAKRVKAMVINALIYDYKVNKNKNAFEALLKITKMNKTYNNFDASTLGTVLGSFGSNNVSMGPPPPPNNSNSGSFDWNQAIAVGGQILNQANNEKKTTTPATTKIDANITPNINIQVPENQKDLFNSNINWDATLSTSNNSGKATDNTLLYIAISFVAVCSISVALYFITRKRG